MQAIIGIDPGLRVTGWGVISVSGNSVGFVDSGYVTSEATRDLSSRLFQLYTGLRSVFEIQRPWHAAIEQTFVNKDAGATLKLGQARGIALLVPALFQIPVFEYAPNLVKKTVVGTGHARKEQIRIMVQRLLPKARCATPDVADALAIALCHAQHYGSSCRLERALLLENEKR